MTETRPGGGTSNTAIVAIVVLILVAVVAFLVFFWNGAETEQPAEGPDIELEVEPPADNGGALDGGNGAGDAGGENGGEGTP